MPQPTPISGSCVWRGEDIAGDSCWRFWLEADELGEIDDGLAAVRARGLGWRELTREDFPLPRLAEKLAAMAEELEHGSGLANLAGLPVERYGDHLRHVWYAIGLHLGTPVYQDSNGLLMRDITDARQDTDTLLGHQLTARDGSTFRSSKARTLSNAELRFHTDRTDVVGLLCVQQAPEGGISRLASSAAVHNAVLARHPELAALLYEPYPRSRLGEEKGGQAMCYELPVFAQLGGLFTSHYSRTYIEAAQEMAGVRRLSPAHWQAMDALHDLAAELSLETRMEAGDMQFLNNHVIYHARSAYRDGRQGPRRLLHRIWLAMANSRALPQDHSVLWRRVEAGALRGGIGQG